MHQRYTLLLLLMVACIATANAQTEINKQQVVIPVTAQTAANAPTEWLPVFAGSRYSIEASFTATAKKTTLSKILKIAGLATATYQTTQNIAWGKGQLKTANPNWLIPVGLGVALGADKLLPHKKVTAYIRYTLYNTDTTIQQVYIEPVSGNKKPVVFNGTIPANGFLTVAFVNTKLIPVTGGNITVSIQQFIDDDNLPIVRKMLDTELLLPEKKALVLPQIEPVPPVLPALYAVAESTAVIVNPITKKGNSHNTYNPPAPTPLKTQSSINKTLRLPNPLPQPVVPETPTIPLPFFLWEALPPKRFVINNEGDDEPDPEPIDDGGFYGLFSDDESYSYGGSYDDGGYYDGYGIEDFYGNEHDSSIETQLPGGWYEIHYTDNDGYEMWELYAPDGLLMDSWDNSGPYDQHGYDEDGYDLDGYDQYGYDEYGNEAPSSTTEIIENKESFDWTDGPPIGNNSFDLKQVLENARQSILVQSIEKTMNMQKIVIRTGIQTYSGPSTFGNGRQLIFIDEKDTENEALLDYVMELTNCSNRARVDELDTKVQNGQINNKKDYVIAKLKIEAEGIINMIKVNTELNLTNQGRNAPLINQFKPDVDKFNNGQITLDDLTTKIANWAWDNKPGLVSNYIQQYYSFGGH